MDGEADRHRLPWSSHPLRVRLVRALALILPCAYLPYSWLLLMDYPWNDYRWFWIRRWPVLPGLLPRGLWLHHAPEPLALLGMAAFTALGLAVFVFMAVRSRRALWLSAGAVLVLSGLNSCGAYHLFRA